MKTKGAQLHKNPLFSTHDDSQHHYLLWFSLAQFWILKLIVYLRCATTGCFRKSNECESMLWVGWLEFFLLCHFSNRLIKMASVRRWRVLGFYNRKLTLYRTASSALPSRETDRCDGRSNYHGNQNCDCCHQSVSVNSPKPSASTCIIRKCVIMNHVVCN